MQSLTFVVCGWTEPRGSRPFFGALLLGAPDASGRLQYVGQTGSGFTDAELGQLWNRLHALRTRTCPFPTPPRLASRPHWVKPRLLVDVTSSGWTAARTLKRPVYVGIHDDKRPNVEHARVEVRARAPEPRETALAAAAERARKATLSKAAVAKLLAQLDEIDSRGGDGALDLPDGDRLDVTNLGKIFWPASKLTKGDLFRHYVRVAPAILPVLADRALVMKRYPNGVAAKPFYQHRAPDSLPAGVRVAMVTAGSEERPHVIGGDLKTLLYTAQLASISQDPWFSRIGHEGVVDHVAIDLDPPDGLPFARVLDLAQWVRDELATLKAPAFAKTSGAGGLHVYVPMAANTPYEAGLLFCQLVATTVAQKHPAFATVERSVAARGRRIYVDYLQNVQGKTLASAYSARASVFAGVSTPITWDEAAAGVSPKDFTLRTFADRLEAAGDLWAGLRKAKGVDLRGLL
jgi:bifunctional non-homologous end joining protein LigD